MRDALGSITQIDTQGYKNGSDSATPDPKTVNTYAWYDGAVTSQIQYWADINTSNPSMGWFRSSPAGPARAFRASTSAPA